MKAEIVAVGTELLLGQIVNTNAQYLSKELAAIGVDVYFQTVVGDNPDRLKQAIVNGKSRADLIIFTGGLGPTQDDLTKDVLASYLNRALEIHQPSMDKISAFFASRGQHMVDSNVRQALMLSGSDPLFNDTGLAVGVGLSQGDTHYVLLPGPPKEMKPMFDNYAKPWIRSVMNDELPLYSKMLKFAGIGESNLEHALIDLIEQQQETSIAPYAKEGEVTIRLSTKAVTEQEAMLKMMPIEEEIRRRVGNHLYAEQDVAIEETIVQKMVKRQLTLSVAESCTGGLLSDLITAVPGSSETFRGGIICYSNDLKNRLLNVPLELLEGDHAPGAVSAETAEMLAEHLLKLTDTDFAVSVTGVAGPSSQEGKPVGLVYVGLAQKGKTTTVHKLQLFGSREMIKLRAAKSVFYHLWERLKQ